MKRGKNIKSYGKNDGLRSASILSRKKNRKNKKSNKIQLPKAMTVDMNNRNNNKNGRVHYKSFSWAKKDKEKEIIKIEHYVFKISTPIIETNVKEYVELDGE